MNKKQQNLCPFCFQENKKWEEYWWCACGEPILSDEDGNIPDECPHCGKGMNDWTLNRVCPHCKSIAPVELEECDEIFPIAVVGPTRSGKTHFLTVLAHEFLTRQIWDDYWTALRVIRRQVITDVGVCQIQQVDEYLKYDDTLYNRVDPGGVDGTLLGTRKDAKMCSLLIELSYNKNWLMRFKEPWKKRKILLALFDTAGEGFNRDNQANVGELPIIKGLYAKALIAMIDPYELCDSEDELPREALISAGILPDEKEAGARVRAHEVLAIPSLKRLVKKLPKIKMILYHQNLNITDTILQTLLWQDCHYLVY